MKSNGNRAASATESSERTGGRSSGRRVGDYELHHVIGRGHFAEVRLGVHVQTRKEYAVKIIDKRSVRLDDGELDARIKTEVSSMQALRHPNIVRIHHVMASEDRFFLVMDYVPNGELLEHISRQQRLSASEARKYFRQLVGAIAYCHKRGVFHRDLKPENLLLDDDLNLKITDFGTSYFLDNSSTNGNLMLFTNIATPAYASPELLTSRMGYNGGKLDVWNCGVILYTMMAGSLPFYADTNRALFRQIVFDDPKYPSWFSPDLISLLDRLLEKNPERRATLVEASRHPWLAEPSPQRLKGLAPPRFDAVDPLELTSANGNTGSLHSNAALAPPPPAPPPPPPPAPTRKRVPHAISLHQRQLFARNASDKLRQSTSDIGAVMKQRAEHARDTDCDQDGDDAHPPSNSREQHAVSLRERPRRSSLRDAKC